MEKIIIQKDTKKDLNILINKDEDLFITLEENAELNLITTMLNDLKESKVNVEVNLNGINSRFLHKCIFVSNKEQKFDLNINAVHNAPFTYSNMLTKGVLNDKSKVNYRGLIKINKDANNSNGYQKEDVILLSKDAESNSIPKLEIDNNDVKCTHGASISQLDEEKLFYLMSRGLNEKEAKITFVKGFLQEIINEAKIDEELIYEKIK